MSRENQRGLQPKFLNFLPLYIYDLGNQRGFHSPNNPTGYVTGRDIFCSTVWQKRRTIGICKASMGVVVNGYTILSKKEKEGEGFLRRKF